MSRNFTLRQQGSALGRMIQHFLGYHSKHSSAVHINTNLICITWRQDEKKTQFLKTVSSPQKHVHIKFNICIFFLYFTHCELDLVLVLQYFIFSLFVYIMSTQMTFGKIHAVQFVHAWKRCSKIKQKTSGRSVHLYSSV